MKNGYKVVDMDTHAGPSVETIFKYVEPSFRSRLPELEVYRGTQEMRQSRDRLRVGTIRYDRFPGTVPDESQAMITPGGRTALEGRAGVGGSSHHRVPPQPGVDGGNVEGWIQDMDLEGRDIDFMYPSGWTSSCIALPDVTLTEGVFRGFNYFYREYCSEHLDRLKGNIQVTGGDVEWAVAEIKTFGKDRWPGGVQVHLPEGMPVDHPDLDPIWEVMNDLDIPYAYHSIFFEPPYWPGYRDIWGNAAVARTAAHPWAAARLCSYFIVGKLFDRFPNLRVTVGEVATAGCPTGSFVWER